MTNQTSVLQDLSYLLGEQSVPTSGIEDRKAFIQRALERVYRIYDFELAKAIATVSLTAGVGSLPTNVRQDGNLDVRVVQGGKNNDLIFTQVPYEQSDNYGAGDYRYWLTGYEGALTLNLSDNTQSAVTLRYITNAPAINASVSTPFPSSMVLARGALVYQRLADDPQADVSQDEALFQAELQEVIAAQNRNRPPRRAQTLQDFHGTYTGDIGRTGSFPTGNDGSWGV